MTAPGPRWSVVELGDARLRLATWGGGPAEIVMLHDGLGSIPQWRDLPARIAEATGATVMAYERPGHGASTPVPAGAWPADWLHAEAARLDALLDHLGSDRPLLVGHSDGGSAALIHAATRPGRARGLVSLAAHSFVEPICSRAIATMREGRAPIVAGLSRSHDHPDAVFEAWSAVWVSEEFSRWDIRPILGGIDVPTVVAQGERDEYGTSAMVTATVAAIGPMARPVLLAGLGHLLHHQDPGTVADLVADHWREVTDG